MSCAIQYIALCGVVRPHSQRDVWRRSAEAPNPEVVQFAMSQQTAPFGHGSEMQRADTEPRPRHILRSPVVRVAAPVTGCLRWSGMSCVIVAKPLQ
jgi:hypothetical protein